MSIQRLATTNPPNGICRLIQANDDSIRSEIEFPVEQIFQGNLFGLRSQQFLS